jgi:hypothetical protein
MADLPDTKPGSPTSNPSPVGTALADFLPIPHDSQRVTDPARVDTANALADEPTLSHALAMDDHAEKGSAQIEHEDEDVTDLGWHEKKDHIASPLVGGMQNEELWLLTRRFNKVSTLPVDAISKALTSKHSKCTTLRRSLMLYLGTWTSTSQTRRSSPQISFEPMLNVYT